MTSSYLGAGAAFAGSSLAGYGNPITTSNITKQDLVIDEGPFLGLVGDCRLIDPVTQDYRYTADGRMVGGIGTQQLVYTALLTLKGSSAVTQLGQSYGNVKVIGSNFQQQISQEVNNALADLTKSGKISINSIDVSKEKNLVRINIRWTDLQRGITLTSIL